jgi:ribosomal protein S18 acetylase RimI-like enzyme
MVGEQDVEWKRSSLVGAWGSTQIARKGELVDAGVLNGFVALEGGEPVGLLTFQVVASSLEVVSLHSERKSIGVGRALMDAARAHAESAGVRRMWLITTNDNVRAIGFYQRWGMQLARVHLDGVARSRRVKPSIPNQNSEGIPIRDELEFELVLPPTP